MDEPYKEILICEYTNDELFDIFVKVIISDFNAEIVHHIKNEDSCYYDFLIGHEQLTLHMDTFVGITIFPTKLSQANSDTHKVTDIIGMNLKLLYVSHLSDIVTSENKKDLN